MTYYSFLLSPLHISFSTHHKWKSPSHDCILGTDAKKASPSENKYKEINFGLQRVEEMHLTCKKKHFSGHRLLILFLKSCFHHFCFVFDITEERWFTGDKYAREKEKRNKSDSIISSSSIIHSPLRNQRPSEIIPRAMRRVLQFTFSFHLFIFTGKAGHDLLYNARW